MAAGRMSAATDITAYQRARTATLARNVRNVRNVRKTTPLYVPPVGAGPVRSIPKRPWLTALDRRIDRCPGCDDWRWDQACRRCGVEVAA
jgi:hypothetical protein